MNIDEFPPRLPPIRARLINNPTVTPSWTVDIAVTEEVNDVVHAVVYRPGVPLSLTTVLHALTAINDNLGIAPALAVVNRLAEHYVGGGLVRAERLVASLPHALACKGKDGLRL